MKMGAAYRRLGKLEEAIQAYTRSLVVDDAQPDVCHELGVLMDNRGRPFKAKVRYMQALEIDPTRAITCLNLGLLLSTDNPAEAELYLQQALDNGLTDEGHRATAHHMLAVLLDNSNRLSEALWHYNEALALLEQAPPELHFSVALVHDALGDTEGYRQHLQKIAEARPDFANVITRLDKLSMTSVSPQRERKTLE